MIATRTVLLWTVAVVMLLGPLAVVGVVVLTSRDTPGAPPLVAAIADSDDGALDGDRTWARAVGPLQFLPSTWDRYGGYGDGDGVTEPQDLDDAAVAAGPVPVRRER